MQPWRFVVVQSPEQKKRLRAASYNQAKVEEASAVIVACGDADGWRKDLDLMLELGREGWDAGELCGAGAEQCSELSVEFQQRTDAGLAEQAW